MISVALVFLMFGLWMYYEVQTSIRAAAIRAKCIENYRLSVQKMLKEKKEPVPEVTIPIPVDISIPITVPETLSPVHELEYTNIAGAVANPTEWWECPHPDLPAPSSAEQLIIDELSQYSVLWYREIEFAGLKVNKYSYPRYDFYLPEHNLIIEYDGRSAHCTPHHKAMDKLKNKFCKENGIHIVRYNSQHYYKMKGTIMTLMKEYCVKRKIPR